MSNPQTGDLIPPSGKQSIPPILPFTGELPHIVVVRSLTDKLYERRKLGALEIETMVKAAKANGEDSVIQLVIRYSLPDSLYVYVSTLRIDFVESSSGNSRKGGLIAMAAAALGLGSDVNKYLDDVVPPVVSCFEDPGNLAFIFSR